MKKSLFKKVIIIFIATILVFIFILFICHLSNNKKDKFVIGETLNIKNATDYLVRYDNGDYYLMKASADITFKVLSENLKYKIVDEHENEIKTKVRKKSNYYEIVANNNYEAGKTYKIVLENGTFVDEKLKDIKILYFTIVRPNSNTQILNENVIKVNNDIITNIIEDDNYYTITSNKEYKAGDILYYQSGNNVMAFKVNSVTNKDKGFIITTIAPTLEEIFKELDIYGEFNLNITDFIPNDDLKDYIEVAITNSNLFDNIIPSVKADSLFEIEIEPQKDGSAKVSVSILLASDENSLFNIEKLKKHDIKLNFELIVKLKAHSDIRIFKQDVGANIEIELGSDISISSNDDEFQSFKRETIKREIDINEIRNKLKTVEKDESKDDISIGKITIPTPVAGLTLNFEVDFIKEIEVALELGLGAKADIDIMFGYNNKGGFYQNYDYKLKKSGYEILGKGEVKVGFEPKLNISFVKVFEAGVKAPLGLYGEGEINYMKSASRDELDGNFEIGTFLDIDLYAKISVGKLELAELTYKVNEVKNPIIKLEGKIKDKCEEKVLNGDFSCYAGIYNNLYDSSDKLILNKDGSIDNRIYGSGVPIEIRKNDDGSYKCIIGMTTLIYGDTIDVYFTLYPESDDKNRVTIIASKGLDAMPYEKE